MNIRDNNKIHIFGVSSLNTKCAVSATNIDDKKWMDMKSPKGNVNVPYRNKGI